MTQAPVLLITFNRPEHTRRTIEALRVQQPPLVYVYQDGARKGNVIDAERCPQVREVIEKEINWECELHTHFSEHNMGCRDAIIFAISSVLKEHESVIVVEDDIITSPAFYTYMCKALEYYRNRPTVWSISGYNIDSNRFSIPKDYDYDVYASPRLLNWGWGTWRDRWERTDWSMSYYDELMRHPFEKQAFARGGGDLLSMLKDEKEGRSSAWDIQFEYAHYANHAVSIVPCVSYTQNIGQDGTGTHSAVRKIVYAISILNQNLNPKLIDSLYFDSRIINELHSLCTPIQLPWYKKLIRKIYKIIGAKIPTCVEPKVYI